MSALLSLGAFFAKHAMIFESDNFAPVCESYLDDDDREVRFTVPYDALADFELPDAAAPALDAVAPAEPFRPRVGRNVPCPCGSVCKYKRCHLASDEGEHAVLHATASTHATDESLSETPVGVRPAGVRRGLGSVRARLCQPRTQCSHDRARPDVRVRAERSDEVVGDEPNYHREPQRSPHFAI